MYQRDCIQPIPRGLTQCMKSKHSPELAFSGLHAKAGIFPGRGNRRGFYKHANFDFENVRDKHGGAAALEETARQNI